MKKIVALMLAALLALASASALAESSETLILTATVEGLDPIVLAAPASGLLAPFSVRAGQMLSSGEAVFTVEPQRVYAGIEGTVADVYAQAGESADAAMDRYGAVMRIEYADRYQIEATNRTGYNTVENRDLRVGMPVYLRSANEKHFADGRITAVEGTQFTVEVIGGDLVFTEDVKVYREADYGDKTLLARSKLSIVQPYAVSASGTITDMAVRPGDEVHPGDYLFSYVPDVLDPARRGTQSPTTVTAPQALIVTEVNAVPGASVQKDQALLTAIPAGTYRLKAQATEGDVGRIAVGDEMMVYFDELDLPSVLATVTAVDPLGNSDGENSRYTVWLDFEAPDGVLPGMHATVQATSGALDRDTPVGLY